jgi:NDP-sugar pyrophosphorylase family protein
MKAMILAAGFGSRLGDLTKETPKCMMPVGETTLLEMVVNRLKELGPTEIIINLYHLAEKVEQYVESRKSFGTQIFLSREKQLLGTGGGVLKVAERLQEEDCFFIYNADVYSEVDLRQLLEAHIRQNALATLAIMNRETSRPLFFDRKMCMLTDSREDSQAFGFTGIHVLSPRIFDYFSGFEEPFSIIDAYKRAVEKGEQILGYDIGETYWIDAGVPSRLENLRSYLAGIMTATQHLNG